MVSHHQNQKKYPDDNPLKISLAILTPDVTVEIPVALLNGTFDERLGRAFRLGYDGVELMVARPAELNAAEISLQIKQHALKVSAISSGAVYKMDKLSLLCADQTERPKAVARLLELVDFAALVGAPLVTIGSFRGKLAWTGNEDAYNYFVEVLKLTCAHAVKQGVLLAIEPLNRYETDVIHTVSEALTLINQVGSPALGVLIDTFHANIEEAQPVESFRKAKQANRLFHIHLGDSNRLPPGQGHFDFVAMVAVLQEIGYSGYLSAELLPQPDPDRAAAMTIQVMRKLVPGPDFVEENE